MILFDIILLFLGISLPLLFAGYIIIRSRKLLGVHFFRKSFWLGIWIPLFSLASMIALHRFSPEVYSSFLLLRTHWSILSSQDILHILVFLLVILSPGFLIGLWSFIWCDAISRRAILSSIASILLFLFLALLWIAILQDHSMIGNSIISGSVLFIILNAISEESNKSLFARSVGSDSIQMLVIMSLVVALGFSFCENIIYTLVQYAKTASLDQVSSLIFTRTFFSMGIHIISTLLAVWVFFWGSKNMYFFHPKIVFWLLLSIIFHTSANIMLESESALLFIFLWFSIFFGISFSFYRMGIILEQKSDSIWQATL